MKKELLLGQLRAKVLDTANLLPVYGLVWMAGGTVIAHDPETDYIVVTPSGLSYKELNPEDMSVVDMNLNLIDGKHRPSVATNLWIEIFKARPDVHAIIHTHSPYATAFSVINKPIPIITETQADWFGAPIPVAKYAHIEDDHFVSAPVEALGEGFAVQLGQHGPIIVGKTLEHAMERAVTLEEAAKIYHIAKNLGHPMEFTKNQALRSFDYYMNRYGQESKSQ